MENETSTKYEEDKTPVTNEAFINMMIQRDEWEDKRINKRMNQMSFTNFWLFIIAMYCLFEMAKQLIPIILGAKLISELF